MSIKSPTFYYQDVNPSLEFYILNIGEGLMILLIFPDNKVMLFDCNVIEDDSDRVIRLLNKLIPDRINPLTNKKEKYIDVFVNSHRDIDHLRGLDTINKNFYIDEVWDSGQSGEADESDEYSYFMKLRREKNKENKLTELKPFSNPIEYGGTNLLCLSSKREISKEEIDKYKLKIQHSNSVVLKIEYGGKSLLLTGDSDWYAWKNFIIPNYKETVNSEILVASHHGSKSFFTVDENEEISIKDYPDSTYFESLDYIDPIIVLISCGEYKVHNHPNIKAMELYNKAPNKQAYTTQNKGILCGIINNNGYFTIVPYRVKNNNNPDSDGNRIEIKCQYRKNNVLTDVNDGDYLKVGGELYFKLYYNRKLLTNTSGMKIEWEVSNGGIDIDDKHQEIFDGYSRSYSYQRELKYVGRHLLRCTLRKRNVDPMTVVFTVNGIKKI